jgi:hypothetical protein
MPDLLSDDPAIYADDVTDLTAGDSPDFEFHNEARRALRALNSYAFGRRGAPGLTVRSVMEDGAVADGTPDNPEPTDNLVAFQATVDAVGVTGGIAFVPAGRFFWRGTLTIPQEVTLCGLGNRSVLRADPIEGPAIRFQEGSHRGGIDSLVVVGREEQPLAMGIDLTGATFLRLRNFQIWFYRIGLRMSDDVTPFAGYNHVSDFEVNNCHVGIRAGAHCNQASVREGRISVCRNDERGIAIDINAATALTVCEVAVENFDLGIRIRGLTEVSLRDVYYEADVPGEPFVPGRWLDIRPRKGSIVRMENSHAGVSRSDTMAGSLEDAITTDAISHVFNGAKRHHAAAPERNLLENGDFHRVSGRTIPGWALNHSPRVSENVTDFVTGGRSFDMTQRTNANDGLMVSFTIPETTDYVTVMVRYKNISSANPMFSVTSQGSSPGQFVDPLPPSEREWRVAAVTHALGPQAAGVVNVILTADQSARGGQIRIDEAWAVVGATAAPARAHAHRVEYLHEPVRIVRRSEVQASAEFGPTDLTRVSGLGRPPRGAIGAVLCVRAISVPVDRSDSVGPGGRLGHIVRPFIQDATTDHRWHLDVISEGVEHDKQIVLRGTSILDGLEVFVNTMTTDYSIEVVGWVLPS